MCDLAESKGNYDSMIYTPEGAPDFPSRIDKTTGIMNDHGSEDLTKYG